MQENTSQRVYFSKISWGDANAASALRQICGLCPQTAPPTQKHLPPPMRCTVPRKLCSTASRWGGSFTLVRRPRRVAPDLNTALMPKSRHTLPPCYVWEKGYWEFLGFVVVFVAGLPGCSSLIKGPRVAIPNECLHEMALL